jgi:16S rRNA (cytidine1402-2'-O)-methyltransferase
MNAQTEDREPIAGAGILYVVATPIGNRGDFSPRAREILSSVALVAAEDTRHTGQLLHGFGVSTPLRAVHEHNETQQTAALLQQLMRGDSIALVSDAGTPLISDPGFDLVRSACEQGIRVSPVPGPCAAIAALSVAGIPSDRFVFEGFLPAKSEARRTRLQELTSEARTLVLYEAPHRIEDMLQTAAECLGSDRRAMVARELTKLYETQYYGTLAQLAQRAHSNPDMARGELVVVIAGSPQTDTLQSAEAERVLRVLTEELPAAQAAKLTAKLTGAPRRDLYDLAVKWRATSE